ncbi:MAG: P-loop NTPase, partial [Rhodoglobus sp.]
VIENMAGLAQPDGTILELFGSGGGVDAAARLSTPEQPVPVLGSVPLSLALREGGDSGVPVVLAQPEDPAATVIRSIAEALSTRSRGLSGRKLGLSPR